MKHRKLYLLLTALIVALSMTACDWRVQSPIVKVTPEPTRMVELAPTPTPKPTGPAVWAPREDPELDELFFNANFALGTDTNVACDGTPTEAPAHANFDESFPDWVEEKYPEGIDIPCPAYNAWQVCQNATNPVACELNVLNALSGEGDYFSEEYFEEQVEEMLADNGHDNLGPEPTATPKASETPAPTAVPVTDTVELELLITDWFTGTNIPTEVTTIKVNTTGGWTVPEPASVMLDDAGVEGADNGKCDGNLSCVDTSGANHNQAQGPVVGDTIPEGSYWTTWVDSIHLEGAEYTLDIPSCGPHCTWGILLRGWHLETHSDAHLPITVSDYGAVGAMKYTRYPVPAGWGQFFSQDYWNDQADNAFNFDNCGIGLQDGVKDCDVVMAALFDFNDGSLTIMRYLGNDQWELVWTNIVAYGRD